MTVYVLIGERYKVEIEGIFESAKAANREKKELEEIYPDKWFHIEEHYIIPKYKPKNK